MENGFWRFCGCRFQVESPKGCAIHHYTKYEDNRFFQRAKKGQTYELPKLFPHEVPGWEMAVSSLGDIRAPVTIFMNTIEDRLGFSCVVNFTSPKAYVEELARIPPWEMLLTKDRDDVSAGEEAKKPKEENELEKKMKDLILDENRGVHFNNAAPHSVYNAVKTEYKTKEKWARKDAKAAPPPASTEPPTTTPKTTKTSTKKKGKGAKDVFRGRFFGKRAAGD